MKSLPMRFLVFVFCTAVSCWSQDRKAGISIGGQVLSLDMDRQEALKKLSLCCQSLPLGDAAVLVSDKKDINQDFGTVYFKNGKVTGIDANRDFNHEPDSYKMALAFYRLVDQIGHGGPARVLIYAGSREMTNGTDKQVNITFENGRSINIEIMNPDPGQKFTQQVSVSECLGVC